MPIASGIDNPPTPPSLNAELPATGMRPAGWGAFWIGLLCLGVGVGLFCSTRRGDL